MRVLHGRVRRKVCRSQDDESVPRVEAVNCAAKCMANGWNCLLANKGIFSSLSIFLSSLMENSCRSKAPNVSKIVLHFQKRVCLRARGRVAVKELTGKATAQFFSTRLRISKVHLKRKWWRLGESKADGRCDSNLRPFCPQ
jgi:hypothetical protein